MFRTIALSTLSMVGAISELEKSVDLTSGFFTGYQMPKISHEITEAYQVVEGQWPQERMPCGESQIISSIKTLNNMFENYENSACKKGESSVCPSYTNAQQTIDFFHQSGIYSDLHSIITYLGQYINACELPKIEGKIKADMISEIKTIMSDLPYSLYLKEAEDVFQMTRHFYSLITAIDGKQYTNMGQQSGYVAFDMKCMYEGKSTFGFLDINELELVSVSNSTNSTSTANATNSTIQSNLTSPTNVTNSTQMNATASNASASNVTNHTKALPFHVNTTINNQTHQEVMRITNNRSRNASIVDGPHAAFMFIEQAKFVMHGEMKDMSTCLNYTNQTDTLIGLYRNMTQKIFGQKTHQSLKSAFTEDMIAINNMLAQGYEDCGVSEDLIWKIRQANRQLWYAEF